LFWKLRSGAPWRDSPERYGSWSTIYDRYRQWCQDGRFHRILLALREQLDQHEHLEWNQWWVDSSSIRASRAAAGAPKKGGRETNQLTMRSGVPKADMAPNCICSLTARVCRWRRTSRLDRHTNRPSSKRWRRAERCGRNVGDHANGRDASAETAVFTPNLFGTGYAHAAWERSFHRVAGAAGIDVAGQSAMTQHAIVGAMSLNAVVAG
jgi:transposase